MWMVFVSIWQQLWEGQGTEDFLRILLSTELCRKPYLIPRLLLNLGTLVGVDISLGNLIRLLASGMIGSVMFFAGFGKGNSGRSWMLLKSLLLQNQMKISYEVII